MAANIYDWSLTDASNSNSDSGITWAEGQAPSTVNNSARVMMTRVKELLTDIGGSLSAGGTANGLTVTAESAFTVYANGQIISFRATADNTGAATLNVNGVGAKAIRKMDSTGDVALTAGEIQNTGIYVAQYSTALNGGAGAWLLVNPTLSASSIGAQPLDSDLTAIAALAKTDGNFIVGNGSAWVAESGATVRTSLGLGTMATQNATAVTITGGSFNGTVGATTPAAATFTTGAFSAALTVQHSGQNIVNKANNATTGPAYMRWQTGDGTNIGYIGMGGADTTLQLARNTTGAIEIDAGGGTITLEDDTTVTGGLSVTGDFDAAGGTFTGNIRSGGDAAASINTAGVVLQLTGRLIATRSADYSLQLNRTTSDGAVANFHRQGTGVGNISVTGSATAYNETSDGRRKENLRDFDSGAFLDNLQVWHFDWKVGGSGYGVIAQDASQVFPHAITYDEQSDLWMADYSKFVPLLLREVKSLRARLKALEV